MVKESLNDGYCDISGNTGDLTLLGELYTVSATSTANNCVQGEMGNLRLYFSKGTVAQTRWEGRSLTELM